jgi:hypothetical protein
VCLVVVWLLALAVTVASTLATRSEFAGTRDAAGFAVIIAVLPAMALTVWLLRLRVLVALAVPVAAVVSCVLAADVLNDQSSTAALGVPAVGLWAAIVIGLALTIQYVIQHRTP